MGVEGDEIIQFPVRALRKELLITDADLAAFLASLDQYLDPAQYSKLPEAIRTPILDVRFSATLKGA